MPKTKNRLEVKDGHLLARTLDWDKKSEQREALTFRHKIFLEELGWSLLDSTGQEIDEYDQSSVHFGAYTDLGKLVGYCRLILSKSGFMIERDFADLVAPGYCIRKEEDTVEISRFAIPKELRGKEEGFRAIGVLLGCVYQWALANKVRYIYGVCASDHLQFVEGFFPCCKSIGPAHEYQPGVSSSALIFDLEQLDLVKVREFWSLVVGKPRS
jgi:N-acyl-L-homoserine lactone synthetase